MQRDQDTTIESERAAINSEIDKYLTAAQILRQQLYRFEPISSLPPEILANIFSFVRDVSPHPLHWIEVTHVQPTGGPRAGLVVPPAACEPTLDGRDAGKGYEEAFQHAARIRHISFDFSKSTEEWQSRVVGNLPMSAPHLETLSIKIGLWRRDIWIPGNALVDAPNLRRLELMKCGPNWDAHWLPQITHLEICQIVKPEQLTWACLMTALRKMKNLESLILFLSFPSNTVTSDGLDQAPLMNINMVQLRVLYVWDKFLAVEFFFRYVTFPPETAVHVTLSFGSEFPMDPEANGVRFVGTLKNMAKSYSNAASSNIVFKNLVVDYPQGAEPRLCVGMFDGIFEESADKFGERIHFYSTLRSIRRGLSLVVETSMNCTSPAWFNTLFRGIFSAGFRLDDITHAHLRSAISLEDILQNPQLLPETVGLLPSLSFIKVSKLAGPWILRAAMCHASEDMGKSTMSLSPFPHLESIHFHDVPFLPNDTTWKDKYPWKALGVVDRDLLQQFLVKRCDTVRRCQLERCFNLTEEDVDELCEVVGDVVCWDGVELEESFEF
ncbi:hypothetical protein HYPSUDRAFT_60198 [Hypholoma sublateritium FD-334 SS-4]|uniref:F-box domain-containing protein n=1 Tax=Hypholoma sublateritium (strain FD-334 SS-4) TaxID=945553 RepID=A0A0D2NW76_HYPSF|nr:hypothetical protein HYPSUDRAFT_60218 [Hypholoma sublateritium FD-334 SS-4]KJA12857.1 hypothetical protein HYPSUDRAFT_60198 [Hypholoma sublateritium FD-334 SS-4]